MTVRRFLVAGLAAAAVAGCAMFQPPPLAVGQTEAEVQALLGAPTGRYALPDGVWRLEFARGPFGRHTWMVDIGPDGRTRRFDQVYPELAAGLDEAAYLPSAEAALRMLDVAEPALRQYMPDFPEQHIPVARRYLASFDGE